MATSKLQNLAIRLRKLEEFVTNLGVELQNTKARAFPSKTQTMTFDGMTRALCVETIDPRKENRIRFYHPRLHRPELPVLSLPFAKAISAMGGFDDCGLNWVPPAGSTVCILCENGNRDQPYYVGTTWDRNRGVGGKGLDHIFPSREWEAVSKGHRYGYLVGDDDESQVFPPWNTESYNGFDVDSTKDFVADPNEQKRTTYPNIYGFKTPEKHMLKMVDGDAKCNRRWKRMEIQSGCGNWMIFKDDHMHYGGQWAHTSCGAKPGDTSPCSDHKDENPYLTNYQGTPIEEGAGCDPGCNSKTGKVSCGKIIGGHPSTPTGTIYENAQSGSNPYFKHANECRAYKGPGTPQNNRIDLPQSGIQMLSISGHTWVMDDSVEEPTGSPKWERSLEPFNFGCNDKFLGRMYMKSTTGHKIEMNDVELETNVRSKNNKIELLTATGNMIQLNDHSFSASTNQTTREREAGGTCIAGAKRGIHLLSTSKHQLNLVDSMNEQCSPPRKEGGEPKANATQAYIEMISGYGLETRWSDDNSQTETQRQFIQITHPQQAIGGADPMANIERGPHFMRFQGRPQGEPGLIFLRAGGHAVRSTYDMDMVFVGDKEKNPSDKFTYVSKMFITITEDHHYRYSGKMHIFFAEDRILLMAGRDCPPKEGKRCKGPCLYPVIIARCPVICPLTGITHWTEKAISERVLASGHHPCQDPPDCGGDCSEYESKMAGAQGAPCSEVDATTLDQDEFETIGEERDPNEVSEEDTYPPVEIIEQETRPTPPEVEI